MLRVVLKGALAHRWRLVATGVGIVLGVAFIAGVLTLTDTIGRDFDNLFARVHGGNDAVIRQQLEIGGGFGPSLRGRVDASVLDRVRAVDGVAHAEGEIDGFAQIVGSDGEPLGNPGQGPPTLGVTWPELDRLNPLVLAEGRGPRAGDEVVIDKRSADLGDLAVGDPITVITKRGPVPLRLVGIARFGNADSPLGASIAAFTSEAAQSLLSDPGQFSQIAVVAEEGVTQTELGRRLTPVLPEGLEVLTGSEFIGDQQADIREALGFFTGFLLIFAGVALFVGMFAIHNTFSIIVAQRTREMALLRLVGASRRQVRRALLAEAALLGLVAGALGIPAGLGIAAGLKGLLALFGVDVPAGGLVLEPRTAVVALVAGVSVTLLSAVFPARRASRVHPLVVLREVALDVSGRSRARLVTGAVLTAVGAGLILLGLASGAEIQVVGLGAAVLFLGITTLGPLFVGPVSRVLAAPIARLRGLPAKLAGENAVRNPRRTAATAAALMIGVALVGTISILAASLKASIARVIDENVEGDFVVESQGFGFGGLSPDVAARLNQRPEVEAAAGLRVAFAEIGGHTEQLFGVDQALMSAIVDIGVEQGDLGDLGRSEFAVLDEVADDEGWALGDPVEVTFADTGPQQLRVSVIYTEDDLAGSFVLGLPAYEANVVDQFDFQVYVKKAPGVSATAARDAVEAVAAGFPNAEVRDLTEFKESQAGQLNQLLGLVYSLLALAVVIALLGIANALALAVTERTRELGLLRAVGMTRGQMRAAVRWESVLISAFGTVVGLAVGLFFAWIVALALSDDGFVFRLPISQVGLVALIATLAGVLAATGPARRAARLRVVEAIATE